MIPLSIENRQRYLKIVYDEIWKISPDYIPLIMPILETIHSDIDEVKKCKRQIIYGWLSRLNITEAYIDDEATELRRPFTFMYIDQWNKLLLYVLLIVQNIDIRFDYNNNKMYSI